MSNAGTCDCGGEESDDSCDVYDMGDDNYNQNDEKNVDAVKGVGGKTVSGASKAKLKKRMPTPERLVGGVAVARLRLRWMLRQASWTSRSASSTGSS